ncbi:MAG: hypothetical protein DMF53_01440 [Acidobacteria bacterium]|nr:MAG: hypothetical protein DMF53_01440 [Acidobacteriota bacterium]
MRRTAGREFSKAIGACNGYEDNLRRGVGPAHPERAPLGDQECGGVRGSAGVAFYGLGKGRAGDGKRGAVERRDLFPQGVASADPHPDSVILWTRRPPVGESRAALLAVEVAEDAAFAHVVSRARAACTACCSR